MLELTSPIGTLYSIQAKYPSRNYAAYYFSLQRQFGNSHRELYHSFLLIIIRTKGSRDII
jgi:hypothetical protein